MNNKSITICGSISAADQMITIEQDLISKGHQVEIPFGAKKYRDNGFVHVPETERAQDKKDHDLIKGYYEKIKQFDAVLVVNPEKNGIPGYIGGNTFLEMGFAHVLNKPLYVLHALPDSSYRDELEAMEPTVIDGDLGKIK